MGKYDPLASFLGQVPLHQTRIRLSFAQIEQILGSTLPDSASKNRPWWRNQITKKQTQASGWLTSGWEVDEVNPKLNWVVFQRYPGTSQTLILENKAIRRVDDHRPKI